jgi:hypothetical protein
MHIFIAFRMSVMVNESFHRYQHSILNEYPACSRTAMLRDVDVVRDAQYLNHLHLAILL